MGSVRLDLGQFDFFEAVGVWKILAAIVWAEMGYYKAETCREFNSASFGVKMGSVRLEMADRQYLQA